MKRFLIVSVLVAFAVKGLACFSPVTHHYFVFSVYNRSLMSDRLERQANQNWRAYTQGAVSEWEGYDADKVMDYARKHNDTEMVAYLKLLNMYLDVCGLQQDKWEYPSKEDILKQAANLKYVKQHALEKTKSKLRSQNALLVMRCNMQLELYDENLKFWKEMEPKLPQTVYKDMMKGLYAHALLQTKKFSQAMEVYGELGDMVSMNWCLQDMIDLNGIKSVYVTSPNSAALPFMVQKFVNIAQDAQDPIPYEAQEETQVDPAYRNEVMQFVNFANQVAAEGRTNMPLLWKSAAAWLQYLYGDAPTAKRFIDEAKNMEGTDRMKDNARVISFFINTALAKNSKKTDEYIADELQWLEQKDKEENELYNLEYGNYAGHYNEMIDRAIYAHLVDLYNHWGRKEVALALVDVFSEKHHGWSSDFFWKYNSQKADDMVKFLKYATGKRKSPKLENWIFERVDVDVDYLNDAIGTKYLAEGNYSKALEYLQKVPLSYLDKQNIKEYAANRSFTVEPWFKVQREDDKDIAEDYHLTTNKKVDFIKDVQALMAKLNVGDEESRAEAAYDLAVRCYQASYKGECWFITHYGQSVCDSAEVGEVDYVMRAVEYLSKAKLSKNEALREKALFGLAFVPLEPWSEEYWAADYSKTLTRVLPNNMQYKALAELRDFYRSHPLSDYASHCDVLKEFMKLN